MKRSIKSTLWLYSLLSIVVLVSPKHAYGESLPDLYDRTIDSVVTIDTQQFVWRNSQIQVIPGKGSGILIGPTLVLTAAHVVENMDNLLVRYRDGTRSGATVLSIESEGDVALLRLDMPHKNPNIATLGDSDATPVGASVFIIGAPYGVEQTLSVGVLSGKTDRGKDSRGNTVPWLQTDCAINPGNSGGPMFNMQGEVIGIVSFILTKSGGNDGVGFARAINSAYKSMIESTGYIGGFAALKLNAHQTRALNAPDSGALVQHIVAGSAAEKIGLKAGAITAQIGSQHLTLGGDMILSAICGACVDTSHQDFLTTIATTLGNQLPLSLNVFRNGEYIVLSNVEYVEQLEHRMNFSL